MAKREEVSIGAPSIVSFNRKMRQIEERGKGRNWKGKYIEKW